MSANETEGLELELEIKAEEIEQKIAPGERVRPFTGGANAWGGREIF